MSLEAAVLVVLVVMVLAHVGTAMMRRAQIDTAARVAVQPVSEEVRRLAERVKEQDERTLRAEVAHKANESETGRRLGELLVHVTRIESGMLGRPDYERLHHRINELGKQVGTSFQGIATDISAAQTKAEQAVARVTRIEQHMMEQKHT